MIKTSIAALIGTSLLLSGCGKPLTANGKTYPTYGYFNAETNKSASVCYEVSIGNVVWSVILVETIIAPVYFVGWDIFNPVRPKTALNDTCGIDGVRP